jgi:nucleoid-associated protein YgaU
MGLFDFLKTSGKKLPPPPSTYKETAPPGVGAEALKLVAERKKAASIVRLIEEHGFKVYELGVRVDGDKVTLTGKADDQAQREKIVLLVGNTEGTAKVDDQMTVAKTEPPAVFYTVVKGDTLSKIAKQHYGNASKYPVIFEANKPMLKDPDEIYPGQVLRIPPAA